MGTIMNGKKWSGACSNGKKVGGLVKNGIAFFKAIIDNVKPDVKYLSYRVDGDSASDPKPYYATNGDKLYVSIAVSEELAEKPIATFTDSEEKQFTSELEFTFINNVGQYIYTSYVEINPNLDVADGVLKVDVTNFKDKAGNILEKTFTSSDIVVDRTPIQKNHIYILNTILSKRQYIRNGEYFMVEMLLLEKSETTPIFTYGHSKAIELPFSSQPTWAPDKYLYRFNREEIDNEILNLLEGEEINFVISNIKDKAGNETIFTNDDISYTAEYGRLTYDNDAPRISGVLDGEIYTNPVTPIIEDPTIDTIILNGNDFISGTTILESGHYELIATDKAQNKTEVVFEITNDTTIINIFDLSKVEFSGNVIKTNTSITFDNSSEKNSTYYNSENILNFKPNITYSTKAKVTHEIIQAGGNTAGSMKGAIWLQKNAGYSYETKYAIVGKSYATSEFVYNTFTTPNDLTGYDFLVTRVDGYSKTKFEDIVIIEGNYDESNFPNI